MLLLLMQLYAAAAAAEQDDDKENEKEEEDDETTTTTTTLCCGARVENSDTSVHFGCPSSTVGQSSKRLSRRQNQNSIRRTMYSTAPQPAGV